MTDTIENIIQRGLMHLSDETLQQLERREYDSVQEAKKVYDAALNQWSPFYKEIELRQQIKARNA